jgi:geranylgeranyl diphosphate synthase type I
MQNIVYATIPGEMLDVIMENRGSATEKEILRMFEGKTSRYTFEGPLHLGAVLAEGSDKIMETFSCYSIPLGKAFQIRDDILGLFGDEKKLGKPVGSDIIESKQTILLIKALERATKDQKEILKSYFGKKNLTKNNLENFKKIIKDTGSLEYCQKLAGSFADESRKAISEIEFKNKEAKIFLNGIIEYVIRREV